MPQCAQRTIGPRIPLCVSRLECPESQSVFGYCPIAESALDIQCYAIAQNKDQQLVPIKTSEDLAAFSADVLSQSSTFTGGVAPGLCQRLRPAPDDKRRKHFLLAFDGATLAAEKAMWRNKVRGRSRNILSLHRSIRCASDAMTFHLCF